MSGTGKTFSPRSACAPPLTPLHLFHTRCIRAVLAFVHSTALSVGELQLVHLVDLLHACESSHDEDRQSRIAPRSMLKALSWLGRVGQVQSLTELLANPLARAFAFPRQPQERREALPLPLGVIAAWESKVCSEDCSPNLRMALGSFLLAAHTSMRFGDIQRIKVDQLGLTAQALRGSCWATKTTKLGQLFACTLFGLTGRSARSSWVPRWLHCMSVAFQHSTSKPLNLPAPDFILPAFARVEGTADPSFAGPMAHKQALALLRWAAQLPWLSQSSSQLSPEEAQAFTLHSLKVALLSAAARLPEESRRQQGHHRLSSVQLYSRDDASESMWAQAQIASALIRGWRPTRPQSRGGQHPVFEPPLSAQPVAERLDSIALDSLPAQLQMFVYAREIPSQACCRKCLPPMSPVHKTQVKKTHTTQRMRRLHPQCA